MSRLENNEKLLEIGKKVYAMTKVELEARLKEISTHIEDCHKNGVLVDNDIQLEAMSITTRIIMDNDMDGSMDGDTCDDCEHCDC